MSDFTTDRSPHRESVDQDFLERSVVRAEDVSTFSSAAPHVRHQGPRRKVNRQVPEIAARAAGDPRVQPEMNRGRNDYQASHYPSWRIIWLVSRDQGGRAADLFLS
jgi:hypothetical protein